MKRNRIIQLSYYNVFDNSTSYVNLILVDYRPRHNEYEKGLKYELYYASYYYDDIGKMIVQPTTTTGYKFSTLQEARDFSIANKFRFLR